MMKIFNLILTALLVFSFGHAIIGQDNIPLLPPSGKGDVSLIEALQKRSSSRNYSDQEITEQQLSDLLWCAFGINRRDENKRTAPSSQNQQEIDIYVFTGKGVFIYNASDHSLLRINNEDLRKITGRQDFVKHTAVNLVYIADHTRSKSNDPVERSKTSHIDTGFISQNVYLYCATQGLGTVVRGWIDKEEIAEKLDLKDTQEVIIAQSIGVIK